MLRLQTPKFIAVLALLLGLAVVPGVSTPVSASTQDGTTAALTDDSPSAQVVRLYEAFFLRTPPDADREFWVGRLNGGQSLNAIADIFAGGDEFQATYGALDNGQFVQLVYNNVLGRPADAAGLAHWTGQLDSGALTRGDVMVGFSNGTEFRGILLARFDDSAVFRLYCAYFLREPDAGGREFWKTSFANGTPIEDISEAFAQSPEFNALYGTSTGTSFVQLVYANVLDRVPDDQGLAFWAGQIDIGARTRGAVMTGFSEAPEYKARFTNNTDCPTNSGPPPAPAPVAVNDTVVAQTGTQIAIPVTANDTVNGGTLSVTAAPANGTAVAAGNKINYTSGGGFTGSVTIGYTLTNGSGSSSATVTVNVQTSVPAPTANDDSHVGASRQGGTITIPVTNNDIVNGATIDIVAQPARGGTAVVSADGLSINIEPDVKSAWDADAITVQYRLTNGGGSSTPATVTIANCEVFYNPPIAGQDDHFLLFLKQKGCSNEYMTMPGLVGELRSEWSDITVNGVPMAHVQDSLSAARVPINPASYPANTLVNINSTMRLFDDMGTADTADDRLLLTNVGFQANYFAVDVPGAAWIGINGTQNAVGVVNPFTGS